MKSVAGVSDDRNAATLRQAVLHSRDACAKFMRLNAHFPAHPLQIAMKGDFPQFIFRPEVFSSGVQRTSSSWMNFAVCSGPESVTGSKPAKINLF